MKGQSDYNRGDIDHGKTVRSLEDSHKEEMNDLERDNIILRADINVLELNITRLENTVDVLDNLLFRLIKAT